MTRLDGRERRVALWAAGFGAVTSVSLYAPAFDDLWAAVILALIGLVMSGLLALAARSRRRLLTCLAAGVLGIGPWGYYYIVGLPFVILAGWLMFRDAKARRPAESVPIRRRRVKEPKSEEAPRKQRTAPTTPARPRQSKRYTPPARRR